MIVIWLELVGIIALMVVVVTVLGAPAASFLPDDVSVRARWALAPALGLAIAICLLTSLNWWMPARTTAYVGLLPALVLAVAIAWRRRSRLRGERARRLAVPALLALAIAVAFSAPLAYQHSLGPGGYQVWDGPNYASAQYGLMYHSVSDTSWTPTWSLSVSNGERSISVNALHQQIGYDAVAAAVDSAAHLSPVETQVADMIALVVIGALGAYAAFMVLLPRRPWAALLTGTLYAGPVTLQLVIDGSEGALAGIAHLLPLLAVGLVALRPDRGRAPAVLFAILAGSAAAAYPVYFPGIVAAAGLIWLIAVAVRLRGIHGPRRPHVVQAVRGLLLVAAGTALVAPFAFHRSIYYWRLLIKGGGEVAGLPVFDLPLPVLPGYVFGTREFFFLPHLSDTSISQWLLTDVLPLTMIGLVVFAVVRIRALWPIALVAVVLLIQSLGVSNSGCSYCVQRSLLPLGPLSGFALAAATVAIAGTRVRSAKLVAAAIGLAVLALTWHTDGTLIRRGALGAFFMPKVETAVLDQADQHPGPVLLEGFMASYDAPGEFPAALLAADGGGYRPDGPRLSVLDETNDFSGLAYVAQPHVSGPEFSPNYRTVITRLGDVHTDRRTLRRSGGLAVQARVKPFDVTAENGFLLNRARNHNHSAFVVGAMSFVVTGPAGRAVALQVTYDDLPRAQVGKLPRGSVVRRTGNRLSVCVPLTGQLAVTRRVVVPTIAAGVAFVSPGWYANRPVAVSGPTLAGMHVVDSCRMSGA